MKVLVLGATGLLGNNVVRALLERGVSVRAFKRPTSRIESLNGLTVEFSEGDIFDRASILRALEGCQAAVHAAPYYPMRTVPVSEAVSCGLGDVRNVMEASREAGIEKVVYTSALTTVGPAAEPGGLADETCAFKTRFPGNPYLAAKAEMESEVLRYARAGVPAVVVIPTAFFGPYDTHLTSGRLIQMIAKRRMPGYIEGRTNVIDVRDVAAGIASALTRGRIGERYILGCWNTTQGELNRLIARTAGVPPPRMKVPFAAARWGSKLGELAFTKLLGMPPPAPAFFVEMLAEFRHYDCSKAIRELDLPQSPVDRAIGDAVAWLRRTGAL